MSVTRHAGVVFGSLPVAAVRHVKLLRDAKSTWALGFPRRWETAQDAYVDLIEMDRPLRQQVLQAVLAAYQEEP